MNALSEVRVGIAELKVIRGRNATVVTHALGSCIGLFAWDPELAVGGCLHAMLPKPQGPVDNAARFVETGVPALIHEAERLGARRNRLVLKVAGGAEMNGDGGLFRIGARNVAALRQALWTVGLVLSAAETGGSIARTARLNLDTGVVQIHSGSQLRTL